MTQVEEMQLERLIRMRDWRLRQDRTTNHEAEATALQWAIDIITARRSSNSNTNGGSSNGSTE